MSASAQVAHTNWCQAPLQKNHSPSSALRANVTNSATALAWILHAAEHRSDLPQPRILQQTRWAITLRGL